MSFDTDQIMNSTKLFLPYALKSILGLHACMRACVHEFKIKVKAERFISINIDKATISNVDCEPCKVIRSTMLE